MKGSHDGALLLQLLYTYNIHIISIYMVAKFCMRFVYTYRAKILSAVYTASTHTYRTFTDSNTETQLNFVSYTRIYIRCSKVSLFK